jgi:hypothetical protein
VAMEAAAVKNVRVTDRALVVELRDGRVVSVPLAWYPRLAEGSPRERRKWELLGPGIGIHWPDLDEDISVDGLLRGLPSGESIASLNTQGVHLPEGSRTVWAISRAIPDAGVYRTRGGGMSRGRGTHLRDAASS